ncbi:2112_t:CDS:2 [Entrophospora sp. SA101]|nr:2112_t:CDS:2 [Entrophospora sp. SA101]CAJ0869261.1 1113_t:CDS:2 [Entrophospora sp. SA101]
MKGVDVDVDYEVIDNEEIYKLTENHDFDEQDNHMELGPQAMYYKSSTSVSSTSSNEDRSEENFVPAYQNESLPDGIVATNSPGIFVFFSSALSFNGEINHTKSNNNSLHAHYNKVHNLIETDYIQGEMQTLYKWMPERIDNVNAQGDVVEWSKSDLGNEWSQVVEYMCKDLNIKYEVFGNENENAP